MIRSSVTWGKTAPFLFTGIAGAMGITLSRTLRSPSCSFFQLALRWGVCCSRLSWQIAASPCSPRLLEAPHSHPFPTWRGSPCVSLIPQLHLKLLFILNGSSACTDTLKYLFVPNILDVFYKLWKSFVLDYLDWGKNEPLTEGKVSHKHLLSLN